MTALGRLLNLEPLNMTTARSVTKMSRVRLTKFSRNSPMLNGIQVRVGLIVDPSKGEENLLISFEKGVVSGNLVFDARRLHACSCHPW